MTKDRYILIHSGNLPEHTEGCTLLGFTKTERGVFDSRAALKEFLSIIAGRDLSDLKLRIINNF